MHEVADAVIPPPPKPPWLFLTAERGRLPVLQTSKADFLVKRVTEKERRAAAEEASARGETPEDAAASEEEEEEEEEAAPGDGVKVSLSVAEEVVTVAIEVPAEAEA